MWKKKCKKCNHWASIKSQRGWRPNFTTVAWRMWGFFCDWAIRESHFHKHEMNRWTARQQLKTYFGNPNIFLQFVISLSVIHNDVTKNSQCFYSARFRWSCFTDLTANVKLNLSSIRKDKQSSHDLMNHKAVIKRCQTALQVKALIVLKKQSQLWLKRQKKTPTPNVKRLEQ